MASRKNGSNLVVKASNEQRLSSQNEPSAAVASIASGRPSRAAAVQGALKAKADQMAYQAALDAAFKGDSGSDDDSDSEDATAKVAVSPKPGVSSPAAVAIRDRLKRKLAARSSAIGAPTGKRAATNRGRDNDNESDGGSSEGSSDNDDAESEYGSSDGSGSEGSESDDESLAPEDEDLEGLKGQDEEDDEDEEEEDNDEEEEDEVTRETRKAETLRSMLLENEPYLSLYPDAHASDKLGGLHEQFPTIDPTSLPLDDRAPSTDALALPPSMLREVSHDFEVGKHFKASYDVKWSPQELVDLDAAMLLVQDAVRCGVRVVDLRVVSDHSRVDLAKLRHVLSTEEVGSERHNLASAQSRRLSDWAKQPAARAVYFLAVLKDTAKTRIAMYRALDKAAVTATTRIVDAVCKGVREMFRTARSLRARSLPVRHIFLKVVVTPSGVTLSACGRVHRTLKETTSSSSGTEIHADDQMGLLVKAYDKYTWSYALGTDGSCTATQLPALPSSKKEKDKAQAERDHWVARAAARAAVYREDDLKSNFVSTTIAVPVEPPTATAGAGTASSSSSAASTAPTEVHLRVYGRNTHDYNKNKAGSFKSAASKALQYSNFFHASTWEVASGAKFTQSGDKQEKRQDDFYAAVQPVVDGILAEAILTAPVAVQQRLVKLRQLPIAQQVGRLFDLGLLRPIFEWVETNRLEAETEALIQEFEKQSSSVDEETDAMPSLNLSVSAAAAAGAKSSLPPGVTREFQRRLAPSLVMRLCGVAYKLTVFDAWAVKPVQTRFTVSRKWSGYSIKPPSFHAIYPFHSISPSKATTGVQVSPSQMATLA